MAPSPQVIIIGAGILGLASAYHILKDQAGLDLLVVDKLAGPGRGDTAKSAAAFRDLFSSPLNRHLSQGSIAFYEEIQNLPNRPTPIGLKKIGYLWLATGEQMERWRQPLARMAQAGVRFQTLEVPELTARLPGLSALDLSFGIFGLDCGILDPSRLAGFYEREVVRMGGRCRYSSEVTGFSQDRKGRINGIRIGEETVSAGTVIVAAGAWTARTLAPAGLEVPIIPRKRQLFSVPAKVGALRRLRETPGFNPYKMLPFTILPNGAYLRPAAASFILGYANPDQPPGLEEPAEAEAAFYETRIRPQVAPYFPAFQGLAPSYAWAGHYDEHPKDSTPIVVGLANAIVVGGSSGSGVMKADSLGRIVAGMVAGLDVVELGHGGRFRVASLGLQPRAAPVEEFVI
ncbi:MAG: FAD-dependent oxidoreductase [Desulfobaccales bacterium]